MWKRFGLEIQPDKMNTRIQIFLLERTGEVGSLKPSILQNEGSPNHRNHFFGVCLFNPSFACLRDKGG